MGLYFRIPLPGPFAYATRIGGHHSTYQRAPGDYSKRELRHQREAANKAARKRLRKPGEIQGAVSSAVLSEDGSEVTAMIYARIGVEGDLGDRIFMSEITVPEVDARGVLFPDALVTIFFNQKTQEPTRVVAGSSWLAPTWNAVHGEPVDGTPIADQIAAKYEEQAKAEADAQAAEDEAQAAWERDLKAESVKVDFGATS